MHQVQETARYTAHSSDDDPDRPGARSVMAASVVEAGEVEERYPRSMTVRYRWKLLRAAKFKLDGGSMFGLVPRVVWSKAAPTDERGRIDVQHNCLLLERVASGPSDPPGPKLVLIEVGSGNKLDAKSRDIFALEERSILDALQEVNCRAEDVGAVIVSHLHFDHAGGLTRLPRAGERTGELNAVTTFPNAEIYAQLREWTDAMANTSVMTRTYFRDHLLPVEDQMHLIESARPFALGATPLRDEVPRTSAMQRVTWLQEMKGAAGVPGVGVLLVPGHTWGQQAILFEDEKGRTVVFTPDVMPTVNHVGAAYSLAYDVEPYTSMISRHWFLEAAVENKWLLVLDHEPGNPVQRVKRKDTWYELVPDSE